MPDHEVVSKDKFGHELMQPGELYWIRWKNNARKDGYLCRLGGFDEETQVQTAASMRAGKCSRHQNMFTSKHTCGRNGDGFDDLRTIEADTIIHRVNLAEDKVDCCWDTKTFYKCASLAVDMKEGDGEIQVTTEAGVAQEAGDQEVEAWAIPACVWFRLNGTRL